MVAVLVGRNGVVLDESQKHIEMAWVKRHFLITTGRFEWET